MVVSFNGRGVLPILYDFWDVTAFLHCIDELNYNVSGPVSDFLCPISVKG